MTLVIPRERLEALSVEALEALVIEAAAVLKARRAKIAASKRLTLEIESYVSFKDNDGNEKVGILKSKARKFAQVHVKRENGAIGDWKVPINMLEPAKSPDEPASTQPQAIMF